MHNYYKLCFYQFKFKICTLTIIFLNNINFRSKIFKRNYDPYKRHNLGNTNKYIYIYETVIIFKINLNNMN